MKQLSTVLADMQKLVEERNENPDILNMQPLGSMEESGKQITVAPASQPPSEKVRAILPENILPKDSESITKATRSEIAEMVTVCYDALETYGKSPEQMKATIKLFCLVLEGRPLEDVRNGFRQWVNRNSKLPTPADIVNIIDPPKQEWRPDWAAYVGLKQRVKTDWYYPTPDERDFMRRCESFAITRSQAHEDRDKIEQQARALMITKETQEQL